MKVALVHYWLVGLRGGEKVLKALADMFPGADIYAHVVDRTSLDDVFSEHRLSETFVGRLPLAKMLYQTYLPLMPFALEQLDLRPYDLVISSESGPAKGVIVPPNVPHVCYCHSPMRYIWDMYHEYRSSANSVTRLMMPLVSHWLRLWDVASASRVDHFAANSHFVAKRIAKYYRRDADVIFPPVDVGSFSVADDVGDYYLLLGELVPYKRADLAVDAFTKLKKRLIVVGAGPELQRLKRRAGRNIEFVGRQSSSVIRNLYARCRALIFPGIEDFGLVPVEAMASGRPVIAFAGGGAIETVVEGVTGHFFYSQDEDCLADAVISFERQLGDFDTAAIRAHAKLFGQEAFKENFARFLAAKTNIACGHFPDRSDSTSRER